MTFNVKFTFHLKNGKTFSCIEEVDNDMFEKFVTTVSVSLKEDRSAMVIFSDCCIRLSDCSVVEWEVINES